MTQTIRLPGKVNKKKSFLRFCVIQLNDFKLKAPT